MEVQNEKELKKNINNEDLKGYIKQKPNKRVMGVKFHLGLYRIGNVVFKKWLKRIGEPPVIFDTALVTKSKKNLSVFLQNKGYYNAKITDSIWYKKHRAYVKYKIIPRKPHLVDTCSYFFTDASIKSIIFSEYPFKELISNTNLDIDKLENEREKITEILQNNGYYGFNKEYIYYEIDTNSQPLKANIVLKIKDVETVLENDSITYSKHKRFKMSNVYIYPNYNMINTNLPIDTFKVGHYYYLYQKKMPYKPQTLLQNIFYDYGDWYQKNNVLLTYKRLSGLRVFKFINIEMRPQIDSTGNFLESHIYLTSLPEQSFVIEAEGIHTAGDLGVSGSFIFQNKNNYKGAEIFEVRFKGAIEMQQNVSADQNETPTPFNTLELGPEMHLRFPQFLLPVKQERFAKSNNPQTTFSGIYNYQKRTDYERNIFKTSFGYRWNETEEKMHILNPIEVNYVKLDAEPEFYAQILQRNDRFTLQNFTDHLTTNTRWTFVFNNQNLKKLSNFTFFRSNVELSGNILNGFNILFNVSKNELNQYELFHVSYSQYVKLDADYRYYQVFDASKSIVYRFFAGLGIPYNNSNVLPFEKSYFAGGSNDLRAWNIRSLGPGSYKDTSDIFFDRTGDIKFEINIEYRFDIHQYVKGAFFTDAGNIWLLHPNSDRINGNFEFNRFFSEIAIGSGFGLRLDFSFFIIRFDAAVPIRDPSFEPNNRWMFNKITTEDITLNLGIGYPF